MSRIPALIFVVLASATVACGSSDPASGTSGSHLFGDDQCKLDPSQCTPPSQPPVSGGQCFSADLSSSACLSSGAWSSIAAAACGAQGAKLRETTFGAPCGATTNGQPGGQNGSQTGGLDPNGKPQATDQGAFQGVKFTCCTAAPPPPQPPPCLKIPMSTAGNPDQSDAARVCSDKQLNVQSVESDANGGRVVVCCPPTQPPQPPPNACTDIKVGDGQTCLSKQALSDSATAACAQQGLALSGLQIVVPCDAQTNGITTAEGVARLAQATCCARPVDGTQPPPDNSFGQKP